MILGGDARLVEVDKHLTYKLELYKVGECRHVYVHYFGYDYSMVGKASGEPEEWEVYRVYDINTCNGCITRHKVMVMVGDARLIGSWTFCSDKIKGYNIKRIADVEDLIFGFKLW
jgi:hypothetical protein